MSLSCIEFRHHVGAVPDSRDPAVLQHRAQCPACAEFAQQYALLDRKLVAALDVPVPEDLKARVIWNQTGRWQRRTRSPWLPMAAAFVMAAGIGFALYSRVPGPLPAAVVAHIEHEPELLVPTSALAQPVRVNAVLTQGGVRLAQPLDNVAHAGLCPFRGQLVPHLVLTIDGEPVSVLLLSNEPQSRSAEIHEEGYHGVIVPRGDGSIAIVSARPELVQPAREQLERAIRWGI